jgi:cytochrome c-type biogenesis protein CcmH
MLLLLAFTAIIVLVVLALSSPFWRKDADTFVVGQGADHNQELADLTIEREVLMDSLEELEVDLAQGRLAADDYARLKATDERRLLQVLDRLDRLASSRAAASHPSPPRRTTPWWVGAVLPGLVVLIASFGIYLYIQARSLENLAALQPQSASGAPDPREMVARLEARLKENPNDLKGQILAGRSYMALERLSDAQGAWAKVLELDPRNAEAHYNLGVILVETRKFDDPELFRAALAHFDKALVDAPTEPGPNWYRGLALWYLKRYRETEEAWTTAFKNLKPGSQDAEFVSGALEKLRAGEVPF